MIYFLVYAEALYMVKQIIFGNNLDFSSNSGIYSKRILLG